MPWTHCERTIPDDEACPGCTISKSAWTVEWNRTRTFSVARRPTVRIKLVDGAGAPVAGERYEAELPDGATLEGTLDDDGYAKVVSPAAGSVLVRFPDRGPGEVEPVPAEEEAGAAEGEGGEGAGGEGEGAGGGEGGGAEPEGEDAGGAGAGGGEGAGSGDEEPPSAAELRCQTGQRLDVRLCSPLRNPRWSTTQARYGEVVELIVDAPSLPEGTRVELEVLEQDVGGEDDPVQRIVAAVHEREVRVGWHVEFFDDSDDAPTEVDRATGFALPEFVFVARYGEHEARCPDALTFQTDLELPLEDAEGRRLADAEYELRCGEQVRRGRTDGEGLLREAGVGPNFEVRLGDGRWVQVVTAAS